MALLCIAFFLVGAGTILAIESLYAESEALVSMFTESVTIYVSSSADGEYQLALEPDELRNIAGHVVVVVRGKAVFLRTSDEEVFSARSVEIRAPKQLMDAEALTAICDLMNSHPESRLWFGLHIQPRSFRHDPTLD